MNEPLSARDRVFPVPECSGGETVWVIGHKNPDADSVGSAIACAHLLRALGVPAEAAIAGPVNGETKCALDLFGLETPPVIGRAEEQPFVLVDHSAYSQAVDGMEFARVAAVVDHHAPGACRRSRWACRVSR